MAKLDAFIFGESHMAPVSAIEQAQKILELSPEFILLEALDNIPPEQTTWINWIYSRSSLDGVRKKGILLESLGVTEDVMQKIDDRLDLEFSEETKRPVTSGDGRRDLERGTGSSMVPRSYDELLKVPFYKMDYSFASALSDVITEATINQPIWDYAAWLVNTIGRFSGRLIDAERTHDFVYQAGADVDAQFVGCDIDKSSIPKNDARAIDRWIRENNIIREKEMGRRINEFSGKRKTDRPILAIVGAYHLRQDSLVRHILDFNTRVRYEIKIQGPGDIMSTIVWKAHHQYP